MNRETIFSPCRRYRYTLWREWSMRDYLGEALMGTNDGERGEASIRERAQSYVQFIGLNPSTADERNDDPTIRRCIDFAKRWGFGALCMTNAFAWRDTDPEKMKAQSNPVCEPLKLANQNDRWILEIAKSAGLVIAAWGKHGTHEHRQMLLTALLHQNGIELHCLGVNDDGTPKHPLYLPKTALPILYTPAPQSASTSPR